MMMAGLTKEEARSRFVLCTVDGALGDTDGTNGDPHADLDDSNTLSWVNKNVSDGDSLVEVAKKFKPNVLLGLTATAGVFNEELVKTVASFHPKPVIMPMSNPTVKAECTPEQAYEWTDGRAVVATGSPFEPVTLKDGRVMTPSQCNNMYIFPGLGLAASVGGVRKITDGMLYKAAEACTNSMSYQEMQEGRTFPHLSRIREVAQNVAVAVIMEAMDHDLTTKIGKRERAEGLDNLIKRKMYDPKYVPIHSETGSGVV
jgi:malate dehydrogenase (oxaloacetate-decarboxylating)(NADP+)